MESRVQRQGLRVHCCERAGTDLLSKQSTPKDIQTQGLNLGWVQERELVLGVPLLQLEG